MNGSEKVKEANMGQTWVKHGSWVLYHHAKSGGDRMSHAGYRQKSVMCFVCHAFGIKEICDIIYAKQCNF